MRNFMRYSWAAGLPLRPLLYVAGTAATAAGVFYFYFYKYLKDHVHGERGFSTFTEDPRQTVKPGLMAGVDRGRVTQTDGAATEELMQDSMQSQFKDILKQRNELLMECEREREAHRILKLQYNQMKEMLTQHEESTKEIMQTHYKDILKQHNELLMECEREREAHRIQKLQYNHMKEMLKNHGVYLDKAGKIYCPAIKYSIESDLMSKVTGSLQNIEASVQQLMEELCETGRKYDDIIMEQKQQQEEDRILKMQCRKILETCIQCYELMKESFCSH